MPSTHNSAGPSYSKNVKRSRSRRKFEKAFQKKIKEKATVGKPLEETNVDDQKLCSLESKSVNVEKIEILELRRVNEKLKVEIHNERLMITKLREQMQTATTSLQTAQRKLKEANEKLGKSDSELRAIAVAQRINNFLQTEIDPIIEKMKSVRNKMASCCREFDESSKEDRKSCENFNTLKLAIDENKNAIKDLKEECLELKQSSQLLGHTYKEFESKFGEIVSVVEKLTHENRAL